MKNEQKISPVSFSLTERIVERIVQITNHDCGSLKNNCVKSQIVQNRSDKSTRLARHRMQRKIIFFWAAAQKARASLNATCVRR